MRGENTGSPLTLRLAGGRAAVHIEPCMKPSRRLTRRDRDRYSHLTNMSLHTHMHNLVRVLLPQVRSQADPLGET